jgi:hypothetical protein
MVKICPAERTTLPGTDFWESSCAVALASSAASSDPGAGDPGKGLELALLGESLDACPDADCVGAI